MFIEPLEAFHYTLNLRNLTMEPKSSSHEDVGDTDNEAASDMVRNKVE